jgi:hypothetical protein
MAPMPILLSDTTTSDSSHKCERLTRRIASNDARFKGTAPPHDFRPGLQAPLFNLVQRRLLRLQSGR